MNSETHITNEGSPSHTRTPIRRLASFLSNIVAQCRGLISSGQVTIDILPDDALLEIFNFYLVGQCSFVAWHMLVHVCRRWRKVVFASPRRLDLRLVCTAGTRTKDMLDIWPSLPLVIRADWHAMFEEKDADNIIAALKHNNRVSQISFHGFPSSLLERIAAVMQEPFPALTFLDISSFYETAAVFPGTLLDGSARHLRSCILRGMALLGIRKLLSSANHLVSLDLWNIPLSGYISPDALVTCLSTMPNLEQLFVGFRSPRSRPHRPNQPPRLLVLTRVVLPSLTHFHFKGVTEYIEEFVSRIDVPVLDKVNITFFNQLIFEIPYLHDFLARAETFKSQSRAAVEFDGHAIHFNLESSFSLQISCAKSDWQLSSMAQVCRSSIPLFSTLERLDLREGSIPPPHWQDDVEYTEWLELFRQFTALKHLYLDKKFAPRVGLALQQLVQERGTDDLPTLKSLFIEGHQPSRPVQESVGKFVDARQLSGFPVMVHRWWKRGS